MVFLEVELSWNVLITPDNLHAERLRLQRAIILRILEDISNRKASKEYGYFVAVTTLENIGEGKVRELTGDVLFPVVFKCVTFKPLKGEVLVGTVDKVLRHGIVLKSGPLEGIFLSAQVMRDFEYVAGDNPMFMSEKLSKLEKGGMVRFKVLGFKWMEIDREFQVLATLAALQNSSNCSPSPGVLLRQSRVLIPSKVLLLLGTGRGCEIGFPQHLHTWGKIYHTDDLAMA